MTLPQGKQTSDLLSDTLTLSFYSEKAVARRSQMTGNWGPGWGQTPGPPARNPWRPLLWLYR